MYPFRHSLRSRNLSRNYQRLYCIAILLFLGAIGLFHCSELSTGVDKPSSGRGELPNIFQRKGKVSFLRQRQPISKAQRRLIREHFPKFGITLRFNETIPLPKSWTTENRRVILEIGIGNGDNLVHHINSPNHKYINLDNKRQQSGSENEDGTPVFIGVEVYRPGIANCLGSLSRCNVSEDQVRLIRAEASTVIQQLPNACLDEVWLLFPDPWVEEHSFHRRLVQVDFMRLLAQKMKDSTDSSFHLATDVKSYADYARDVVSKITEWKEVRVGVNEPPPWRAGFITQYERKGIEEGRDIHDVTFNLKM